MPDLRRRQFITLLGGAAAVWPLAAWAQQRAMPVVGYLSSRSPEDTTHLLAGFRQGLADSGFVEHQNVTIEYRWALGQYDHLPALATELTRLDEINAAFRTMVQQQTAALILAADPFFDTRRSQLVVLAAYNSLPAIYQFREYAAAGGLMSYGIDAVDAYRQIGIYAARILKGARPV